MGDRNRVGTELVCCLAGWYDNRIPTRVLAPIDCSKISALYSRVGNGRWGPGAQNSAPKGIPADNSESYIRYSLI
jgi:hypothetical protein